MDFGVVLQTDPPARRVVDFARKAEALGFTHAYTFDSHVLWQEPFVIYSAMLAGTSEMVVGPMVTNPGTRDWTVTASMFATLNDMYGERTVCAIGRGDSAMRVLGLKPCNLATLEESMGVIKGLAEGGTVILSETTEMIGAEHVLAKRAAAPEIARQVKALVRGREREIRALGDSLMGGNPSPGNLAGGITTLEEKSLGCIYKAGRGAIQEVLEFGQRPSRRGLVIMDTPGNDVESLTGMAAGGAQIGLFTTGRGSPVGCAFMPVLKVASNTPMFERMRPNMDINAGTILDGSESLRSVGERIFNAIVEVASGRKTKAEALGYQDFVVFKRDRAAEHLLGFC